MAAAEGETRSTPINRNTTAKEGSGQGQQKVEPEPDVLLPEGEGDTVRKVGEAGHEGRGLGLGILRS